MLVIIFNIYSKNKLNQSDQIKEAIENIYLKKTINEITKNLKPRYTNINYISKSGDTYENIINNLDIDNAEKKIILSSILKEKSIKILKVNQKFYFKIDNLNNKKVIKFTIETNKKNEILFYKKNDVSEKYLTKKIEKNFLKKIVYKETIITNSLYNSAIELGISPNKINFVNMDIDKFHNYKYDFIISNPPYIKKFDLKRLENNVKLYEPIEALEAGTDGFREIKKVIIKSSKLLKNNGQLIFEIGENQVEYSKYLLKKNGFYINKICSDIYSKPRVIRSTKRA